MNMGAFLMILIFLLLTVAPPFIIMAPIRSRSRKK